MLFPSASLHIHKKLCGNIRLYQHKSQFTTQISVHLYKDTNLRSKSEWIPDICFNYNIHVIQPKVHQGYGIAVQKVNRAWHTRSWTQSYVALRKYIRRNNFYTRSGGRELRNLSHQRLFRMLTAATSNACHTYYISINFISLLGAKLDKGGKEVSYLMLLVYSRKTILGLKSGVQCFGNKYVFLFVHRKPGSFSHWKQLLRRILDYPIPPTKKDTFW
jgi:hypothetical protein